MNLLRLFSRSKYSEVFLFVGVLLIGFLIRLVLAPHEGNDFDIAVNQGWAKSGVYLGIARSYIAQLDGIMLPNHPPISIILFTMIGHIYQQLFSPEIDVYSPLFRVLIKLPAIVADMGIATVFYVVCARVWDKRVALLSAAVVLLNPASMFNSAVWGQIDAIPIAFMFVAFAFLFWKKSFIAGIFGALAVLTKVQAVIFLPVLLFATITKPKELLRGILGALLATIVIAIPFIREGTLHQVIGVYTDSVGYYPTLSSAAYNFWWLLFGDSAWFKSSTDLFFGLIQYRLLGLLLFAFLSGWALVLMNKQIFSSSTKERITGILLASTVIAYAFFLFNSEMHERYLFPFVVFGIALLWEGKQGIALYISGSLFFLFNMMGVVPFSIVDISLFREFPTFDVIVAFGHTTTFVLLLKFLNERYGTAHLSLLKRLMPWRKS